MFEASAGISEARAPWHLGARESSRQPLATFWYVQCIARSVAKHVWKMFSDNYLSIKGGKKKGHDRALRDIRATRRTPHSKKSTDRLVQPGRARMIVELNAADPSANLLVRRIKCYFLVNQSFHIMKCLFIVPPGSRRNLIAQRTARARARKNI